MKAKTLLPILMVQLIAASIIMMTLTSAQNQPTIKVEPTSITAPTSYVNETFSINVTINDVDVALKIIAVQFRLRYNTTLLEVVDVVEGPFLADINNDLKVDMKDIAAIAKNFGNYWRI